MYLSTCEIPQPLTYAKRVITNSKGQKGTVTHDPGEIDEITRHLWDKVYDGNPKNQSARIAEFYEEYKGYIKHQSPMPIRPLTVDDVATACQKANRIAAGLDHFAPEDFSRFSQKAYAHLAVLYNTIEDGANWPKDSYLARAAFLSKSHDQTDDPLAYRALTILNVLYRKWATARLATLRAWVATWDQKEICAGGIGKGGEDGWYRTAAMLENWEVNGTWYSGGAIDIRKCFDQIPRPVLYGLARKAGMPRKVLVAYLHFQEHLKSYNTIPGGLGEPYKKKCSITQGDPLSMMFVGLYLRPWVKRMEQIGATPRVLADDMLITVHGPNHVEIFKQAMDETHQFLKDIGSAIAPEKHIFLQ